MQVFAFPMRQLILLLQKEASNCFLCILRQSHWISALFAFSVSIQKYHYHHNGSVHNSKSFIHFELKELKTLIFITYLYPSVNSAFSCNLYTFYQICIHFHLICMHIIIKFCFTILQSLYDHLLPHSTCKIWAQFHGLHYFLLI